MSGQSLAGHAAWVDGGADRAEDVHVGWRTLVDLDHESDLVVQLCCSGPWRLSVDGDAVAEGSSRWAATRPEIDQIALHVGPGRVRLDLHVHHLGVATRVQPLLPPFVAVQVAEGGEPVATEWLAAVLPGYRSTGRRTSPILGWVEWWDGAALEPRWAAPLPAEVSVLGLPIASDAPPLRHIAVALRSAGAGRLHETAGFYELDDPPVRFYVRDLAPAEEHLVDGCWWRFDLGRVRLGVPTFEIAAPQGTIVEWALSETLVGGRVAPWYFGSTGPSCTVAHCVHPGGSAVVRPLSPLGGRFMELHVLGPPDDVELLDAAFDERTGLPEPVGSFSASDALLDRIWTVGVDTLQSCTEDAVTDCPTRERGQWLGDVASVGLEVAAVAHQDLGVFRRGLVQATTCARADGLVAGLYPGHVAYISTYALQWVSACVRYAELSGDRSVLEELLPFARRTVDIVSEHLGPDGVDVAQVPWSFVDWGRPPAEGADLSVALHLLAAARALARWEAAVGRDRGAEARASAVLAVVEAALARRCAQGGLALHEAALGLRQQVGGAGAAGALAASVRAHLLAGFPNDPDGPRIASPHEHDTRTITPYFAHFSLAALAEYGDLEFVLGQYRSCWGWMLDQGATTWWELFDDRYSRCHQWSACPTWQLSRYVLGVQPAFLESADLIELRPAHGGLDWAQGQVPIADGAINVRWDREDDALRVRIQASRPVRFRLPDGEVVAAVSEWAGRVHSCSILRE